MALYVGVDGVARNVKKIYVGVDGIARQVKRAYVGVDGVARLFYSTTKKIVYYGNAPDDLSAARSSMGAANVGNYVLFAGGYNGSSSTSTVDAYNSSLTRTTATNLSVARHYVVGCSIGDYALFAGGYAYTGSSSGSSSSSTVDAYNSSLTRTTATNLSVARYYSVGCSIIDHVIFAGGQYSTTTSYAAVDAYSGYSLTKTILTELVCAQYQSGAASIGGFALIGGGVADDSRIMTAYNEQLTRVDCPNIEGTDRFIGIAASIGKYALFPGGRDVNIVAVFTTQYE